MRHAILLATVAATTMGDLTPAERTELAADLKQWQQLFGQEALTQGFLPRLHGLSAAESDDELLHRMKAAKERIPALQAQNPDAQFSHLSPLALLTKAEFKAYVMSSFQRGKPKRALRASKVDWAALQGSTAAGSVDWTTSKCVTPVKNQGQCGSCWAFSGTGAAESAHCIATGTLLDLAEQQVVDCDTAGYNQGCNGGMEDAAITWIQKNGGLCLTKDYPYTSGSSGQSGRCKSSCTKQKLSIGATVNIKGESPLTTALDTQPVAVAVEAGNDVWQYYKGGVVSQCPGAQSDHAVIAVGYGSDGGKNYFKIRNSWGANWGEKGYIRLQRGVGGKGMCNVAEMPAYPKINAGPKPTHKPTDEPTEEPTDEPTDEPSDEPTDTPSGSGSDESPSGSGSDESPSGSGSDEFPSDSGSDEFPGSDSWSNSGDNSMDGSDDWDWNWRL
ncbi:cysteine protease family C01A [Achlya hypogyna]|uniref:Cysteine protease family C01A n=1 Tax=Achlya hypogyna TaxID=1202772 RepID=A0A1V9YT51_ACHHY|nr:cysteine protease family C01A [Achlya hypogyna]